MPVACGGRRSPLHGKAAGQPASGSWRPALFGDGVLDEDVDQPVIASLPGLEFNVVNLAQYRWDLNHDAF
jgi:hypothetical protein